MRSACHSFPPRLRQPRARTPRRRDRRRALAEPLHHHRACAPFRNPGIRTRRDRRRERVRPAAPRALRGAAAGGSGGGWIPGRHAGHERQWRDGLVGPCGGRGREDRHVGTGIRRHGRRLHRSARGHPQPSDLRHGRDLDGCRAHPGRHATGHQRDRDRICDADPCADGRRADRGRGRRVHRQGQRPRASSRSAPKAQVRAPVRSVTGAVERSPRFRMPTCSLAGSIPRCWRRSKAA